MKAVVIYESMFGNTRLVAEAIAEGMAHYAAVELYEVSQAPHSIPADVDVLVVGGPTHAFGLSRPQTRHDAAQKAADELVSPGIGIREWIAALPSNDGKIASAAFDTKISKPAWLPGSAARGAAKRLRQLGFREATPATSFYVTDVTGPLVHDELSRARGWGDLIGRSLNQPAHPVPLRQKKQ